MYAYVELYKFMLTYVVYVPFVICLPNLLLYFSLFYCLSPRKKDTFVLLVVPSIMFLYNAIHYKITITSINYSAACWTCLWVAFCVVGFGFSIRLYLDIFLTFECLSFSYMYILLINI